MEGGRTSCRVRYGRATAFAMEIWERLTHECCAF